MGKFDKLRTELASVMHILGRPEEEQDEGGAVGEQTRLGRIAAELFRERKRRSRYFQSTVFGEPAWDMLLELFAAETEGREIDMSSLCSASGVPATTALRWINSMAQAGLLVRVPSISDARRKLISLTPDTAARMRAYLREVSQAGLRER